MKGQPMKTGTTFSQGQLAQLGNNMNIAIATALPKVAAGFDPKSLLRAMEGRGQFMADKLGLALEQIFKSLFVLGMPGAMTVTLAEQHDPVTFYQTRTGLCVWPDFQTRIVAQARPTDAGTVSKLDHAILTENMTDEQIEAVLPKEHLFTETLVCAAIAGLIALQPNGEDGVLLNNGYANLFYMCSCVVGVRWYAVGRGWDVSTWRRDDSRWGAGGQVFSPATAA